MTGTLYVVATPIGNLDDFSARARQTLENVDLIAAEDTRRTGRLLSHFSIETPQIALHDHNEKTVAKRIIEALNNGDRVALVSDAGTPLISDPGYALVKLAHGDNIPVVAIAGPSAVMAALSVAGLPTDRFCFEGFLPAKSKARRQALAALAHEARTMVFFEAVHRVRDTLADMVDGFGPQRMGFLGRELTKLHEQSVRAPLADLLTQFDEGDIKGKGEFVLCVIGNPDSPSSSLEVDTLLAALVGRLPPKEAAKVAAELTGESRNALYQRLLDIKS
ncbi:MAG: 16S rRNA (cytidine(1402)-2'-O)-methyltransferase [Pseudomonadota bacterium]